MEKKLQQILLNGSVIEFIVKELAIMLVLHVNILNLQCEQYMTVLAFICNLHTQFSKWLNLNVCLRKTMLRQYILHE